MDEHDDGNLDTEYKRYLQIMRPYLGQLIDQDVIDICNAWIQRLSNCSETEKYLRNKYVFTLCYQLAKGVLEDPFLNYPPVNALQPFSETCSEVSSSELECLVIDSEEASTKIVYESHKSPVSEGENISPEYKDNNKKNANHVHVNYNNGQNKEEINNNLTACNEVIVRQVNIDTLKTSTNILTTNDKYYEHRANNLIMKLRQIKEENLLLQNELIILKEESRYKPENIDLNKNNVIKIDNATSACIRSNDSTTILRSLQCKLQEVQESRDILIAKVGELQEKLDNINEIKRQELEDTQVNHKLEIVNMKTAVRNEVKDIYEKKLDELKTSYECRLKDIEQHHSKEIQSSLITKNELVEKDNLIKFKDLEIERHKAQLEEQKKHLHSILNNFFDKSSEENSESERMKSQQLEKRLNRVEKSKTKCIKAFEFKLTELQRQKHLTECALQLQLIKQRAQIVNEIAEENQIEVATALDKLESKYKDIIANVQATAIQRRIQDQLALESILHRVLGIQDDNHVPMKRSQFTAKTMRNDNKNFNVSFDTQFSPILRDQKLGIQVDTSKSIGEGSVITGYCLDSERLGELFDRVYVPQRDTGEGSKK